LTPIRGSAARLAVDEKQRALDKFKASGEKPTSFLRSSSFDRDAE
jgi:hypothetical protein